MQDEMTADEIADNLSVAKSAVYTALNTLGIEPHKPMSGDRRRRVYPPGTLEKVRQYLATNR